MPTRKSPAQHLADEESRYASGTGIPIDIYGGPTIDPTKNVLDLVRAESKYQDAMRETVRLFQDAMRNSLKEYSEKLSKTTTTQQNLARAHDTVFQNYARESEARFSAALRRESEDKTDKLAQLRQVYETRIAEMLSKSVDSTQALVANQLVQIQNTFNERVSKLEEFRWSMVGKTSVADPAMSEAMTRITTGLASLKLDTDERLAKIARDGIDQTAKLASALNAMSGKEAKVEGGKSGQMMAIGWFIAAAMLLAAIATPTIAFFAMRAH